MNQPGSRIENTQALEQADSEANFKQQISERFNVDPQELPESLLLKFQNNIDVVDKAAYDDISSAIGKWPNNAKRGLLFKAFVMGMTNPRYIEALADICTKFFEGEVIYVYLDSQPALYKALDKFLEIFSRTEDIRSTFEGFYAKAPIEDEAALEKLQQDLSDKAYEALIKALKIIRNQPQHWTEESAEKVFSEVNKINADAATFSTVFKNVSQRLKDEGGTIHFYDFVDTRREIAEAYEITMDELKEMEEIYRKNYPTPPYPAEFRETLIKTIIPWDQTKGHFYLVKHKDKITAFARFINYHDKKGNLEYISFGAFNVDPSYGGGLIGEEMMGQFLKLESVFNVPIRANCDPKTSIAKKYIEFGFVATKSEAYLGIPALAIELSPKSKSMKTKQLSWQEIEKLSSNDNGEVKMVVSEKEEPLNFDLLSQGFVMTRFKQDKKDGKVYCVFERSEEIGEADSTTA